METKVLIISRHGLGDCVQLTAVLLHLRDCHPEWKIHVAALRGKHSAFYGLADQVFVIDDGLPSTFDYTTVYDLSWEECQESYGDYPSTKVVKCMRDVFGINPKERLLKYQIAPPDTKTKKRVNSYVSSLPTERYVCIHYEGNTSQCEKNLSHKVIRQLCNQILFWDLTPIILDWDFRSPLPDNKAIFCPDIRHSIWKGYGTGDAATICELMRGASLAVCIDSGPQKVALAAGTPLLTVWTGYHPIHYMDYCPKTCRCLVPVGHRKNIRGKNREQAEAYFSSHYNAYYYDNLETTIIYQARQLLTITENII
jgi:ADP-heptose:LPS heptosyltransferase